VDELASTTLFPKKGDTMKSAKAAKVLVSILALPFFAACTNPSVPAGEVGYVTNQPIMIGEKGEFLGIIIGPSSYGFGWANKIKLAVSYKPFTIKEHFTPIKGEGDSEKQDTRIMSKDKINMEVNVSVVMVLRNSPAMPDFDEAMFEANARIYFEDYVNCWPDRYKEPFRTMLRNLLGEETYSSAKKSRIELSGKAMEWLATELADTPLQVLSVNISNINPPARMLAEQELLKAVEIAENRQEVEKRLQDSRKQVLEQEATNLAAALAIAPDYLTWKDLQIKRSYADGFNNLITGEEAKAIGKVIFMPYGTPVAATADQLTTKTK
jgi:regulator of protease activity HflC (stomatin/prohibitin superfamily)